MPLCRAIANDAFSSGQVSAVGAGRNCPVRDRSRDTVIGSCRDPTRLTLARRPVRRGACVETSGSSGRAGGGSRLLCYRRGLGQDDAASHAGLGCRQVERPSACGDRHQRRWREHRDPDPLANLVVFLRLRGGYKQHSGMRSGLRKRVGDPSAYGDHALPSHLWPLDEAPRGPEWEETDGALSGAAMATRRTVGATLRTPAHRNGDSLCDHARAQKSWSR